jgi:DNA-binding PadR family transcriptional regulator
LPLDFSQQVSNNISDIDISYTECFVSHEKTSGREPRDLVPLSPAVLNIMLALAGEERHGYGIMREVDERTGGRTKLGPGTLYGSIKRMLADGLIEESDERPDPAMDDQRRRYYRITDFGRRVAGAEAERLSGLVETARARKLLRGGGSSVPEGL